MTSLPQDLADTGKKSHCATEKYCLVLLSQRRATFFE